MLAPRGYPESSPVQQRVAICVDQAVAVLFRLGDKLVKQAPVELATAQVYVVPGDALRSCLS